MTQGISIKKCNNPKILQKVSDRTKKAPLQLEILYNLVSVSLYECTYLTFSLIWDMLSIILTVYNIFDDVQKVRKLGGAQKENQDCGKWAGYADSSPLILLFFSAHRSSVHNTSLFSAVPCIWQKFPATLSVTQLHH